MRTILAVGAALPALFIAGAALAEAPDDLPPNAVPGHCYQHITTPDVTETYQDRVVDSPEHAVTRTIPAVYGEQEKSVMIIPGRVEHIHIPTTWRTVTETEVIRPESTRTEVIPARYDWVRDRALVSEAHTEWRRGAPGPVSDPDMPRNPSYLDVVCLIEVPAEYRWETRKILREPERIIHYETPAEVRTRSREVIDQPARDEERQVPPVYQVVKEQVVIQPARTETYTVPATYRMVTRVRVVTPGHLEWREYPCRHVIHPHRQPPPDTDGERGALDPKLASPDAARKALGQ